MVLPEVDLVNSDYRGPIRSIVTTVYAMHHSSDNNGTYSSTEVERCGCQ